MFGHLLEKCDLKTLCNVERVCLQWREYLAATDGVGAWQVGVHRELGPERIEKYKNALGLRSGQGWDAEKVDLTARNWKRIMRMHRATKMLPKYRSKPLITPLAGHSGPVLCMTLGKCVSLMKQ